MACLQVYTILEIIIKFTGDSYQTTFSGSAKDANVAMCVQFINMLSDIAGQSPLAYFLWHNFFGKDTFGNMRRNTIGVQAEIDEVVQNGFGIPWKDKPTLVKVKVKHAGDWCYLDSLHFGPCGPNSKQGMSCACPVTYGDRNRLCVITTVRDVMQGTAFPAITVNGRTFFKVEDFKQASKMRFRCLRTLYITSFEQAQHLQEFFVINPRVAREGGYCPCMCACYHPPSRCPAGDAQATSDAAASNNSEGVDASDDDSGDTCPALHPPASSPACDPSSTANVSDAPAPPVGPPASYSAAPQQRTFIFEDARRSKKRQKQSAATNKPRQANISVPASCAGMTNETNTSQPAAAGAGTSRITGAPQINPRPKCLCGAKLAHILQVEFFRSILSWSDVDEPSDVLPCIRQHRAECADGCHLCTIGEDEQVVTVILECKRDRALSPQCVFRCAADEMVWCLTHAVMRITENMAYITLVHAAQRERLQDVIAIWDLLGVKCSGVCDDKGNIPHPSFSGEDARKLIECGWPPALEAIFDDESDPLRLLLGNIWMTWTNLRDALRKPRFKNDQEKEHVLFAITDFAAAWLTVGCPDRDLYSMYVHKVVQETKWIVYDVGSIVKLCNEGMEAHHKPMRESLVKCYNGGIDAHATPGEVAGRVGIHRMTVEALRAVMVCRRCDELHCHHHLWERRLPPSDKNKDN
jgi:hypothetical protein